MKSIQEETVEYQAVVDLLPQVIDFAEKNAYKLSFICNPFRIKNLLDKLYSLVKLPIFNYELCLMTELVNYNNPEKGKIYLEKIDNKFRYVVQDPNCNKQEDFINMEVTEVLTKENLNDNKSEILTTIMNRRHIYAINHYRFSIVKIHLVYIRDIFENHVSNNRIINLKIISIIKQQEHAVRVYYKWLKESIESLQDLNRRIVKNITKSPSNKIQSFLLRGANPIEGKLANGQLLSNIITDSKENQKNVFEKFYNLFVEHAFAIIREDQNSEQQLQLLQDTIINKIETIKGLHLHQYFDKLIASAVVHPCGYIMPLLKNFCTNHQVIENVTCCPEQYVESIVKFLKFIEQGYLGGSVAKGYSMEYSKLLAKLILLFPKDIFISTIKNCFSVVNLFFQPIYEAWLAAFLEINENNSSINKIKLQHISNNIKELFIHFCKLGSGMLYEQMQNTINLGNAKTTNIILISIFANDFIVKFLSSFTDPMEVKYFLDDIFFKLLLGWKSLESDFFIEHESVLFLNFALYISSFDRNKLSVVENIQQKFKQLSSCMHADLGPYIELQREQRLGVLDILKVTVEHGSWSLRLNSVIAILTNINNNKYVNSTLDHVKAEMLSMFIANEDHSITPGFYKHLAKTGHIHLFKNIISPERRALVLEQIKRSNKAFRGYFVYLQKSGTSFDLSQLTAGFNVPFYLFFTEKLNLPVGDYNLIVSVVFKIFSHAIDDYQSRNIDDYKLEFNEIIHSLQRLLKFYEEKQQEFKTKDYYIKEIQKGYEQLKQDTIRFIIEGFSEDSNDSLMERKTNARLILDNAINYKASLQQICSVNAVLALELHDSKEETVAIIKQFFIEISNIFKNTLNRNGKTLAAWVDSTSSIGEKISFLCARRKYAESDFKTWFFKQNANKITEQRLEAELKLVRKDLHELSHQAALSKVGINYLQYNQEYALALVYQHLADNSKTLIEGYNNLFMQLGTGQGKSLVIAETARKILTEGSVAKQVFVITCYAHLAIRDHKKFELYFNSFGIKSICCVNLTEQQTKDVNLLLNHSIIYTDLKSYFDLIRSERRKFLEDHPGLLFPDPSNAILIMDEFDSLILDADEIYQILENFPGVGLLPGDQKQKLKAFFGLNDGYTDLALQNKLFNQWYDTMLLEQQHNPDGYSRENALGVIGKFAKAFLQHLQETGTAQFVHSFLSPLLFYTQFKKVIGFSGSITEQAMLDLEKVFCSSTGQPKRSEYYCIPPFFGEENGKNRIFANGPNGKLCDSEIEFLDEVIKDVKEKRQQGQPILIFADVSPKQGVGEKTDFDLIKVRLQKLVAEEQLHIVKDEEDLIKKLHYIGKKDNVTLASRILARGADIKVDGYITKGLHLVVTYYPPRGSVYTQMLGRTARQDEYGSYSVITMKPANYRKGHPYVYSTERKSHELCTYFFDQNRQGKKKWPLVFDIMRETLMHEDLEQLKTTLDRNFPVVKGV